MTVGASDKGAALRPAIAARPSPLQRLRYNLQIAASQPTTLIGVLTAALFTYLIVVPIISMLLGCRAGAARRRAADQQADVGDLTLVLPRADLHLARRASASSGGRSSTRCRWRSARSSLAVARGRHPRLAALPAPTCSAARWFATALIVPYMLPAWTFALAWTTLFKNRTVGGQAGWFEALGLTPPDWLAYGRLPVTIILALHYSPFIILLFGNALRRFDIPARGFGAHSRRQDATDGGIRQIILPLMRPAADVGDGPDLRQVPRRVRRALRAWPAGQVRRAGDLALSATSPRARRASPLCSPARSC